MNEIKQMFSPLFKKINRCWERLVKQRAEPNRKVHIPSDLHRTQSAAQPPTNLVNLLFIIQLSSSPTSNYNYYFIFKLVDLFLTTIFLDVLNWALSDAVN